MDQSFLTNDNIEKIVLNLMNELNLQQTPDTQEKCRNFVLNVLKNKIMEDSDTEIFNKKVVDECKNIYTREICNYNAQFKENIFFEESNVKKLVQQFMNNTNRRSEDFMACKTFVAIVMKMIFSKEIQYIDMISEETLDHLNKKTVDECVYMFDSELGKNK